MTHLRQVLTVDEISGSPPLCESSIWHELGLSRRIAIGSGNLTFLTGFHTPAGSTT